MVSKKSEKAMVPKPHAPNDSANLPRRPGRPAGAAKGTERRTLLLDTALVLFARWGIADTPLTMIAREAGVTPAMLHYYFNTREQLLDVLIEERFLPIRASFRSLFNDQADDPVAALTTLAKHFIDISVTHDWFAPLWIREIISESGMLKQRMEARYGDSQRNESLRSLLRWQQEGKLNADLDPELIFISLFGLTFLPIAAAKRRHHAHVSPFNSEQLAKHVVALLLHGINPLPVQQTGQ